MKKYVLLLLAMVLSLSLVGGVYAADTEITYGAEKVKLTLVDNLDDVEIGKGMFGTFESVDGAIKITTQDCADDYDIKLSQSESNAAAYAGKKYFVLNIQNNSDGDVKFCVMTRVNNSEDNLFLRSSDPAKTALVDLDGAMTEAEWVSDPSEMNGRFGFTLPEGFEGYVFIPFTSICQHEKWDTSYITEAAPLQQLGMHVLTDGSSYAEVFVNDLYVADTLPVYQAPKVTEAPATTVPTATAPAATAAAPETQKATAAPTASPAPKAADDSSRTTTIILCCAAGAVVIAGIIIAVVIVRKKKKK